MTTLELTMLLDQLKDHNGIKEEELIKLARELKKFGPYYIGVLENIIRAYNQIEDDVIIVK